MTTTLDISALANAIVWPIIILVLALAYRVPLLALVKEMKSRVKSFSLAGVSVEITEATQLAMPIADAAIDLRNAGQSTDVNDSTLRTFYEQVRDPATLDFAVVDLGTGHEWLSSRLYIMSVILRRMRGLKLIVFVETAGGMRRRFLGACDCDRLRWKLAARYPWFEAAISLAEARTWTFAQPSPVNGATGRELAQSLRQIKIVNDDGRVEDWQASPQPAADLLKVFLDGVQAPALPVPEQGWETLPISSSHPAPLIEHAEWLTGQLVEDVLGKDLQTRSIRERDLQGKNPADRARLVLEHPHRWIAIVRDEGIFDRIIDRLPIVEEVARIAAAAPNQTER